MNSKWGVASNGGSPLGFFVFGLVGISGIKALRLLKIHGHQILSLSLEASCAFILGWKGRLFCESDDYLFGSKILPLIN